jgi:hypothetical protein
MTVHSIHLMVRWLVASWNRNAEHGSIWAMVVEGYDGWHGTYHSLEIRPMQGYFCVAILSLHNIIPERSGQIAKTWNP